MFRGTRTACTVQAPAAAVVSSASAGGPPGISGPRCRRAATSQAGFSRHAPARGPVSAATDRARSPESEENGSRRRVGEV